MPVACLKWKKQKLKPNEDYIKRYDEEIDKGYILEVGICYPKELHDLYSHISFLAERIKINKFNKLVCNL